MKSWKTTLFACIAATGAAVLGAYQLQPDLLAGFPPWIKGVALLMSVIGGACTGIFARDNNVTSEQAGAAPKVGLLFIPLLACLVFTGCSSTPARIAYNVEAAGEVTVDQAMTGWGDWVAHQADAGTPVPAEQEQAVASAFGKYVVAMTAAVDASQNYTQLLASGSTNAPIALLLSQAGAQTVAQTLADLVAVIRKLEVKL
jgi:hypothetical protein